jgi:hypothetical protein
MTAKEFYRTARISEDTIQNTVDVRPFGDRQVEAVDWYLADRVREMTTGTLSAEHPTVVLYSRAVTLDLQSTMESLKFLKKHDFRIDVRKADSESEAESASASAD